MSEKEAYEKKMQARLDEWSAEIDKLRARADQAGADARIQMHKEIDRARARFDAANEKLKELKNTGDDAWEDIKNGLEGAWSSLDTALQAAKSRFE